MLQKPELSRLFVREEPPEDNPDTAEKENEQTDRLGY